MHAHSATQTCPEALRGEGLPAGALHLAGGRHASWALQPGGLERSSEDSAGGSPCPGYGRAKAGAGRRSRRNPSNLVGRHPEPPARSGQRGVPRPHPAPLPAPAALPLPPLSRAEFPPLLIVRGPAPAQPCPARHCRRRRAQGRGRGTARTALSRSSRYPGRSRADTARHAAARRSSAAWRRAPAQLCRSGREEGPPERRSGARVTARPPQPPPGLRERRPSSHAPGARTLRRPRSHLLRARGQDTMRSALALSALLLLLPPLPSLSQGGKWWPGPAGTPPGPRRARAPRLGRPAVDRRASRPAGGSRPLRRPPARATHRVLTLHHPRPFQPENAAGAGPSVDHLWSRVGAVGEELGRGGRGVGGTRALDGISGKEIWNSGHHEAPTRPPRLWRDPQGLITPFLRVGRDEGRYCVAVDYWPEALRRKSPKQVTSLR